MARRLSLLAVTSAAFLLPVPSSAAALCPADSDRGMALAIVSALLVVAVAFSRRRGK